jgi:hypothetical protein
MKILPSLMVLTLLTVGTAALAADDDRIVSTQATGFHSQTQPVRYYGDDYRWRDYRPRRHYRRDRDWYYERPRHFHRPPPWYYRDYHDRRDYWGFRDYRHPRYDRRYWRDWRDGRDWRRPR